MSKREAEDSRDSLLNALTNYFDVGDEGLMIATHHRFDHTAGVWPVWGAVDDEQLAQFTDAWLRLAQKQPVMADAARTAIAGGDWVMALKTIGPPAAKSMQLLVMDQQLRRQEQKAKKNGANRH